MDAGVDRRVDARFGHVLLRSSVQRAGNAGELTLRRSKIIMCFTLNSAAE